MGDHRESIVIVGVKEEKPISISLPSSSPSNNPSPAAVGAERWAIAEQSTSKIICQVQPTGVSEERRREVIDYIQRLIRGSLGCEIFPFGSVPLKTYLPDGDIDLTAFGGVNIEDALANDVVSVLLEEDQNSAAEFVVKDVQLIRAEVKLVKCIVQNIVVDISFNQLGGLCTLCFLEQVDRLIGKDHLFKRSIILIKAWCYYESRILGAHHGLISTYALETLVLYIFHVFHSTLNGPLAVLYKFLDYFSNFDWDNYCISLSGPIRMSSLPELVAESPDTGGGDLLLSNDFLRYCLDTFSVPSRGVDVNSRAFPPKHLNIVDPLKENNNLGRSVSKGNLYRIRSAFTYGARKLGRILLQPDEKIADELCKFFSNTLDRHGSGLRPDVQGPVQISSPYNLGPVSPFLETDSFEELNSVPDDVSQTDTKFSRNENGHANGTGVLGYRCSGDAKDLATSKLQGLNISNGPPTKISPPGVVHFAPHLYFSGFSGNMKPSHGNSDEGTDNVVGHGEVQSSVVRPKEVSPLSDLCGDYESHYNSLQHGRWCSDYNSNKRVLPPPPPPPCWRFPSNGMWHASQHKQNGFSGVIPKPVFYPTINGLLIPGPVYGLGEMPKPRGLGTYFPNTNRPPYHENPKPPSAREKIPGQVRSPRNNNWVATTPAEVFKRSTHEASQAPDQVGGGTPGLLDTAQSVSNINNGFTHHSEGPVDFESNSVGPGPGPGPSQELNNPSSPAQTSTQSRVARGSPRMKPVLEINRLSMQSAYHLKDEEDFPPLSV